MRRGPIKKETLEQAKPMIIEMAPIVLIRCVGNVMGGAVLHRNIVRVGNVHNAQNDRNMFGPRLFRASGPHRPKSSPNQANLIKITHSLEHDIWGCQLCQIWDSNGDIQSSNNICSKDEHAQARMMGSTQTIPSDLQPFS